MLGNLDKYHVVLASNSPRRKELLGGLGIPYEVRTIDGIDESYPDNFSKSYKINFPNAIYIIKFSNNKVNDIYAYSYAEYLGSETQLYEYPMPNELSGNKICMGSAKREIIDSNYIEALERIIATSYTHRTFSGIKGFSNSEKWFEYLSKNKFPYKLMRSLNKKLKDIVI